MATNALQKNERTIMFYEVTARVSRTQQRGITPKSLKELFELVKACFSEINLALTATNNGKDRFYKLSEIDINDEEIVILIRNNDDDGSDSVVVDKNNGARRVLAKGKDESYEYASHVYIKLQNNPHKPYLAVIEQCPYISASVIRRILNSVIKQSIEKNEKLFLSPDLSGATDKTDKPKMYKYQMLLEFHGHIDEHFAEMLRKGKISEAKLLTTNSSVISAIDMTDRNIVREFEIKINLLPIKGNPITRLLAFGKKMNFNKLKVQLKDDDGSKTVDIDVQTGDPIDDIRFVKKTIISGFNPPLSNSHATINNDILSKIKASL